MTSDDPQAIFAALFPGKPTTFTEYETGLTVPSVPQTGPTDTERYLGAASKAAVGIGEAGRSIGAGRAAQVEGKIAGKIARIEAEKERAKGRRLVSTAKAVAGAQGSGEGLPLLSELSILQAAHTDANAELWKGNINEYHARQKAKAAYMKAPADLLSGLLEASYELDPEAKKRAGKSLLTGK